MSKVFPVKTMSTTTVKYFFFVVDREMVTNYFNSKNLLNAFIYFFKFNFKQEETKLYTDLHSLHHKSI